MIALLTSLSAGNILVRSKSEWIYYNNKLKSLLHDPFYMAQLSQRLFCFPEKLHNIFYSQISAAHPDFPVIHTTLVVKIRKHVGKFIMGNFINKCKKDELK